MSTSLRNATTDDIPRLIELGNRLRLEAAVWFPPCEPEYLTETLKRQFSSPENYCCIVAENGSNIVGWLNGLIATPYEWSPMRVAAQRILYVAPEARSLKVVRGLIRAYVSWAEARGVTRQLIGIGNGLNLEKVDRFYRRLGFELIGGQYLRDSWVSKPS